MFVNNLNIYKMIFIVELLVAEFLFTFRLERRKHFAWRVAGCIVVSVLAAIFIPIFSFSAWYSSLLFFVLFCITIGGLILCYKEKPFNVVYCAVAAYTVRHLSFQIFSVYMTVINGSNTEINSIYGVTNTAISYDGWFWFSLVSFLAVYFILYVLFFTLFGKRFGTERGLELKNTRMFAIVVLVLFLDIIISLIATYNEVEGNYLNTTVFFINTLIVYVYNILCCLFTIYMQMNMIEKDKMKRDLQIINHLWQQDKEQYRISKENIELINLKCHDLKHQIRQIIEGGVDAQAVKEVENIISIYGSMIKTGNETIDVIFTEKSLICQKNNIVLNCMADGNSLSFMDTADIYILFGNLMDNAIEAVQKLEDTEKRVIAINMHQEGEMFLASISNYFSGDIELNENGLPKSRKKEKNFHGFGTKSIDLIIKKYFGAIDFSVNDDVFTANMVIPIPQEAAD